MMPFQKEKRQSRAGFPSLNSLSQASSVSAGTWVGNEEVTYTTTHLQGVKKEIREQQTYFLLLPGVQLMTRGPCFCLQCFPPTTCSSQKTGWDCAIPKILCNKSIATLTFPLQLYRNSFLLLPTNAVSPELKLCFCLEHFSATDMQL